MATMTEPKVDKKTLVHYLVEGGVAIIELDDPPANTYTHEMMRQLDDAILQVRFDDTAHVLVLRGHGEKFFSAGANIAYLNSITPRYKYFFCLHANETLNRSEEHTSELQSHSDLVCRLLLALLPLSTTLFPYTTLFRSPRDDAPAGRRDPAGALRRHGSRAGAARPR